MQVGYMGVPYSGGDMTDHLQYVTVRNERGSEMLDAVRRAGGLLEVPASRSGNRRSLVMQVSRRQVAMYEALPLLPSCSVHDIELGLDRLSSACGSIDNCSCSCSRAADPVHDMRSYCWPCA